MSVWLGALKRQGLCDLGTWSGEGPGGHGELLSAPHTRSQGGIQVGILLDK